MKIAQIAPLEEAVPPRLYGGTERVVAYLTDALVELGHEVTLFASGDSQTRAELAPSWPRALRLDPVKEPTIPMVTHLQRVAARAGEFDLIHSHIDFQAYSVLGRLAAPSVTTLHGRLDLPELAPLYALYREARVVSISHAQRRALPHARYVGNIHHGLPEDLLHRGDGAGGYLAFLGRISPEKGPDAAIRIAAAAGRPLKMAAKIGAADRHYHDAVIAPLLPNSSTTFVGEITERGKQSFLGNAAALLFPIAWPEPFGLVLIEAMACGTPVIAFDHGSVREIIEDGVTGFIVHNEAEAVDALSRLGALDRARIRAEFEQRFTARRMALRYVDLYRKLCAPAIETPAAELLPELPLNRRDPASLELGA